MSIPMNSKEPQVVAPLRDELPLAQMEPLLAESRAEGHHFVDRLVDDFMDGSNRFDQPGEALFGNLNWIQENEEDVAIFVEALVSTWQDMHEDPTIIRRETNPDGNVRFV
mgnify:CR=1 FL=1